MTKLTAFLITAFMLTFAPTRGNAAIVNSFSDDFEGESLSTNYTSFAKWNVTDGSVDTVGPGDSFGLTCQGSAVCVDLDGTTTDAGTLQTKDSFAAGTYQLSFDLSYNQRNGDSDSAHIVLGDHVVDISLAASPTPVNPWITFSYFVTVDGGGDDFLTISGLGGDNIGLLLDNVSVSLVPVPAALPLFLSGLAVFGFLGRKRRAATAV